MASAATFCGKKERLVAVDRCLLAQHVGCMPKASLRSLASALDAEIVHLQRCRGWLRRVDQDLLRTGMKCFSSEVEFSRWLTSPHATLKGRAPIEVMFARDGKSLVQGILVRMCEEKSPRAQPDRTKQWKQFLAYLKRVPKMPDGSLQLRKTVKRPMSPKKLGRLAALLSHSPTSRAVRIKNHIAKGFYGKARPVRLHTKRVL